MTREEIRDEIWDAMMNRMDIDVSTTDLADAALERLESLGLLAASPNMDREDNHATSNRG
jgi:hypothetical protein